MPAWYSSKVDSITLVLHVQPGAKQTTVAGLHGDALKIRLAAPPVEGCANEALLRFIADFFKVPLRDVELKQGEQSRHKRVAVRGSAVDPASLLGWRTILILEGDCLRISSTNLCQPEEFIPDTAQYCIPPSARHDANGT